MQYFSFAKFGIPYMGVGRNLAYRKDVFYKVNGFIDHMHINSGDDDLFINSVANKNNTALCYSPNSFTKSIPKLSFMTWFIQKRRHISTAKHYKLLHKLLLAEFYSSQFLFWLLSIILMVVNVKLTIILPLFIFTVIIKYLIFGYASKKLNETDLIIFIPFLELFLIFIQFSIFISNLVSKPKHWK